MQCTLTESNAEILLLMPNILEWGYDKINLFELHIKSDTVIINYTTTEGKQRDFINYLSLLIRYAETLYHSGL